MFTKNVTCYRQERFTHPRKAADRKVPIVPPLGKKIKLLIDTDAACEIDDQYAIAMALLMPERFQIEGLVATHFGSPDTIQKSYDEIILVLEKAGMTGRYPVALGGPPLPWDDYCVESDGANLIIEKAMAASPEDPLWVVAIGQASNVAAAYMMQPDIAKNINLVFHTRSITQERATNWNVMGDDRAARQVFNSDIPLVMYDTGTYIRWTVAESEKKIKPHGPLGEYLHNLRHKHPSFELPTKGLFDLGDIVFLADPESSEWEQINLPTLSFSGTFTYNSTLGQGLRVHYTSARRCLSLLHEKLAAFAGR